MKPNGRSILKYIGFLLIPFFYFLGGINHFRNPSFYLPLIPPYLPFPEAINLIAGVAEVVLAAGFVFARTRRLSAIWIIVMLIAFIPSHVYMIQLGGCIADGLCVPVWVAWVRLIIIHPLLMLWVWAYRDSDINLFKPGQMFL